MGTRGSAEDRAREAADAAKILGTSWRQALDIPDGRVENTWENRLESCARAAGAETASGDTSILEGAASGPLHGVGAGI